MTLTRHDRFGLDWRPERIRRLLDFDFDMSDLIKVEELSEGDEHVIRAELPGIDPEKDVELTVSGGFLHVLARRTEQSEHKDKKGFRSEFRYGEFGRDIDLPAGAKEADIKAKYRDGILEIRVPVGPEMKEPVTHVLVEHAKP